jgi:glycosyltransferase involved in cell wall biosynthesis
MDGSDLSVRHGPIWTLAYGGEASVVVNYGLLSTYPPTQCGLATFTAALAAGLADETDGQCGVLRVVDRREVADRPEVIGQLVRGEPGSRPAAANALNSFDVVIVQHEYGIYGGLDGDDVLAVLDRLRVPVIAVLHTVLVTPTARQRRVLEAVGAAADAIVTMTETARHRLIGGYRVDSAKVVVIPHGARDVPVLPPAACRSRRPTVLTWGLLGPGKGIEWAVEALRYLRDRVPAARYVIAGRTHPKVLEREGESYRSGLAALAAELGVAGMVEFEPGYLNAPLLARLVQQADAVVLPYDSPEQVTSGVLIEAVSSLTPVVATRFPHAVELLGSGAGLLVPHRDAAAMARALARILTEPGLPARMSAEAARLAPGLRWSAVAGRYADLANDVLSSCTAVVA